MASFSNGTEGMMYNGTYCFQCVNWLQREGEGAAGCPVWDMHLLHSDRDHKKGFEKALDFFIPDHVFKDNRCVMQRCKMFLPREREVPPRTPPPEKEKLAGAASLEVDVLVDAIGRAKARKIVAGGKPTIIVMNQTTAVTLMNGNAIVVKNTVWTVCNLGFLCNDNIKDGEFVLLDRHSTEGR